MIRKFAAIALCLGLATIPQALMAQAGQGRGGEMRDTVPGEQIRQDAGRSGDHRRDEAQRDRRYEADQPGDARARAERMRESERAWEENKRERSKN
jgi:hypothetical protein